MAIIKTSIAQLREKAPYILKRKGHAKQKKKLLKAYHGKRLKKWWSSYASWECCKIEELKDAEHVGHRMKGGHRHNHIYNKCHKHVFRSKLSRKNIDREDKKEFVRVFYLGLRLNHNFGEFLHKIFHKNNKSTAHKAKEKMMTKFARKKPVTIECMKYNGFNFDEVKKFCGDAAETHPNIERGCYELFIKTLEGNHHASEGDVIIKGVNGEFYPCKPDIFAKTYEFVDAPEAKPTDFVHSFSWALDRLKEGKRIHRSGWNGKGMLAVLQKGYPDGIPCNKQTAEAWGLNEGDLFRCEPYMQLKMVNGSHSMWVPSVNDCLSNDWAIVE